MHHFSCDQSGADANYAGALLAASGELVEKE